MFEFVNRIGCIFLSREFVIFILTGGLAASANFLSRIALSSYLGMDFYLAVIIAYIIGMVIAYILFKIVVFKKNDNEISLKKSIMFFCIVNLIGILLTFCLSNFLYYVLLKNLHFFRAEISHGIGIMLPAVSSYIGHKYFSFK